MPHVYEQVKERDGYQCVKCGATDRLSIHHLDWNQENDAIENLVTLCLRCHAKENREPKRLVVKVCEVCGGEFETAFVQNKFCHECSRKGRGKLIKSKRTPIKMRLGKHYFVDPRFNRKYHKLRCSAVPKRILKYQDGYYEMDGDYLILYPHALYPELFSWGMKRRLQEKLKEVKRETQKRLRDF